MNSYAEQRRAQLLELLGPQATTDDVVAALSDFVESEVRSAYRRGYRHGSDRGGSNTRRRYGEKGSAVQNGLLRPAAQGN
ncbi:MAG: hypothetical protein JW940_32465 [Polyangiaceae bacterium]|nr:hypothetical protein [Polyangiaceae bacterium]